MRDVLSKKCKTEILIIHMPIERLYHNRKHITRLAEAMIYLGWRSIGADCWDMGGTLFRSKLWRGEISRRASCIIVIHNVTHGDLAKVGDILHVRQHARHPHIYNSHLKGYYPDLLTNSSTRDYPPKTSDSKRNDFTLMQLCRRVFAFYVNTLKGGSTSIFGVFMPLLSYRIDCSEL